jgi:hypothetical protein
MSSQWFRFSESWVAERCAASYAPKHLRSRPRMDREWPCFSSAPRLPRYEVEQVGTTLHKSFEFMTFIDHREPVSVGRDHGD